MEENLEAKFAAGSQFQSYAELEEAVERYQDENYCQLCKRDCRLLSNARRRITGTKIYNEDLRYFEVSYSCYYGGKPYKSCSKGLRLRPSKKSDCPFKLALRVSDDGMYLIVKTFIHAHNHERNQELYKRLPRNRCLFGESRKKAADLIHQGLDNKRVQQLMFQETGKMVDIKVLKNISTELKGKKRQIEKEDLIDGDDQWSDEEEDVLVDILDVVEDEQQSPMLHPKPAKPESYQVNHHNHHLLIIEALANDDAFMDVTLTAQGRSVKAHKSVLSAVSPYFREVLRANPCQHPIIIMPRDVRFDELYNIIQFIYKGEMTVATEELTSLLKTAEALQVSGLATFHTTLGVDVNEEPNSRRNSNASSCLGSTSRRNVGSCLTPESSSKRNVHTSANSKSVSKRVVSKSISSLNSRKRQKSEYPEDYKIELKPEDVCFAQQTEDIHTQSSSKSPGSFPAKTKCRVLEESRLNPTQNDQIQPEIIPATEIHCASPPATAVEINKSRHRKRDCDTQEESEVVDASVENLKDHVSDSSQRKGDLVKKEVSERIYVSDEKM